MRKQILTTEEHNRASVDLVSLDEASYNVNAVKFEPVNYYTTFRAEYAVKDDCDLVFHFFATNEINKLPDPWMYWKVTFPDVLEQIAPSFFKSGPPELRAAYTDELASWWLQADGAAGKVLNPDLYASKFLEELDGVLDKRFQC